MTDRAALAEALHFAVGPIHERPGAGKGPLAGQRLIVKDLFHVAGEPTFGGGDSPIEPLAIGTAPAVQRLIDAGAVYIGKAQMVQLAFGGWGTNACVGAPRNPWDADVFRVAGGSSSGSAVAVAAGFADLALGSDTGGSIRIPASLCGIVGLRPSQGRISLDGVMPLAPSLDSAGPMARTVADVAAAFAVLAGEPMVEGPAPVASLSLRILSDDALVADEEVAHAYRAVASRLGHNGATLRSPPLPAAPRDYVAPTGQVMGYEAWAEHGARITAGAATADPGVLRRFQAVSGIDEASYRAAQATRDADRRQFADWFEGADFLLTPATAWTAPPIADVDEGDFTLAYYTRMANYLDLCAIALPCGFDRLGLPIGIQLIGRAGDEGKLIAAAWSIERLLALPPRLPPLHASRCAN
ncbi:aspartyl-tRNA(Asn)/glutamyl-tRNA(Gln) amidotransferase subunit A [Sphingomonas vulcanisoli]|uniref:Aspartyl-tRNA(Asn)/glutamyl-tRNA(Gln) amidotransferase subunit A n=1 Tax=Sphingomonas vulcanisoli TaxID=1658060 RepID=A0ABX0TVX6_9SPHN|nr:amidase [Sphingomonas vulcanisoli]NIJ08532.1 aspartyl-tRNA(Asn)/glutamyl-tRNA(Gln) amidotransferase subunit A [Sphingomonas vulcanisoli]